MQRVATYQIKVSNKAGKDIITSVARCDLKIEITSNYMQIIRIVPNCVLNNCKNIANIDSKLTNVCQTWEIHTGYSNIFRITFKLDNNKTAFLVVFR